MKRWLIWAISAVLFGCDQIEHFLRKLTGLPRRERSTVLVYHDVTPGDGPSFGWQMKHLSRCRRFVGDVKALVKLPATTPDGVWITFDDAYEGVFQTALPILEKYRIPAVVFVPAEWIGQFPGWKSHSGLGRGKSRIATLELLRKNSGGMITYGSHGMLHLSLLEASDDEAHREIRESKSRLETLLKSPVSVYAFAYGHYGPRDLLICRDSGYDAAFSALSSWRGKDGSGFLIGRTSVSPGDHPAEFFLKVRGAYRWQGEVVQLRRRLRRSLTSSRNDSVETALQRL